MADTRIEKDSMGEMAVPAEALFGASTQRAVLNFPVSDRRVPDEMIRAYAVLKSACATANHALGRLDDRRTDDIVAACAQIDAGLPEHGGLDPHFPVSVYQTGSGTSTNMNVNEVVANLACLAHGEPIGRSKDPAWYKDPSDGGAGGVHPNDHVNMGQSSNDTFPTAMHIAGSRAIRDRLAPAVDALAASLEAKAAAWDSVIKIGRTHLQDATPIRLGQEFSGYAAQLRQAQKRLDRALVTLGELALGGTAVGTGINTHPEFGRRVAELVSDSTGISFTEAANHFEAQHAKDAFVEASGHLRTLAISLSKIANDIRWLGSGPRCGIGELVLPAVQPGSSIMPGKINPVICEAVIMASAQVLGHDHAVTLGGLGGVGSVLDLNVAMPMMAWSLLDSARLLADASDMFRERLIEGLEPDRARCEALIEGSLAMCTSLVPEIGYDASSKLAFQAFETGKTIRELALEQKLVPEARLAELLDPASMTQPHA
ncbi:MAG: class II fumarate hydratase [Planctomycetota bacterium]